MPLIRCIYEQSEKKNAFLVAKDKSTVRRVVQTFQQWVPHQWTSNSEWPYVTLLQCDETVSWCDVVSETGAQCAIRYCGAVPSWHRHIITRVCTWCAQKITVELPRATDHSSCCIQHSLQSVGNFRAQTKTTLQQSTWNVMKVCTTWQVL